VFLLQNMKSYGVNRQHLRGTRKLMFLRIDRNLPNYTAPYPKNLNLDNKVGTSSIVYCKFSTGEMA
jgi:hypothetical protein